MRPISLTIQDISIESVEVLANILGFEICSDEEGQMIIYTGLYDPDNKEERE
jgi:hypothetical protein